MSEVTNYPVAFVAHVLVSICRRRLDDFLVWVPHPLWQAVNNCPTWLHTNALHHIHGTNIRPCTQDCSRVFSVEVEHPQ